MPTFRFAASSRFRPANPKNSGDLFFTNPALEDYGINFWVSFNQAPSVQLRAGILNRALRPRLIK